MDDTNSKPRLNEEQFMAAHAALGALPPRWRWIKRRRWYAAEWELYQRFDGMNGILERIAQAINAQIDSDSRRRR